MIPYTTLPTVMPTSMLLLYDASWITAVNDDDSFKHSSLSTPQQEPHYTSGLERISLKWESSFIPLLALSLEHPGRNNLS